MTGRGDVGHAKARTVDFTPVVRLLSVRSKHDVFFLENAINTLNVFVESTGVPQLTVPQLSQYEIFFPPTITEEKKIGEFFENLDNRIRTQQQLIKTLKKYKRGLLQNMFPQKGTTTPKLRFPEFTDAWEQCKLGDIASLITKGATPLDKSNTGDINFIKIESIDEASGEIIITQKITNEEHEGYLRRSQLKENDILFSIAGALGRVASVKSSILPANINQALAIIRLKSGDLQYVKTYLKSNSVLDYIKKNHTIGAQPNLSLEQVCNLEIAFPSIDEQTKIGEFFENLEILIYKEENLLSQIKQTKTALLQQLFV